MLADPELLIVGAGPAGLAAASEATRAGVRTMIVDAGESTGGQYYARPPGGTWDDGLPPDLVAGARAELLDVQLRTAVWGAFGDTVAVARDRQSQLLRPGAIILATGATERIVPFPGWDRPGVVAPGGLQRLYKVGRVIPNGAVVLAGSGPFLFAVAAGLRRAGAQLRAVVELRTQRELAALVPALLRNGDRRREALRFGRALRGVDLRFGVGVSGADEHGVILTDGTRLEADVLSVGHGFRPRLDLARLLGLELSVSGVRVDATLQAGRAGVFAAGEVTGIGGAPLAAAEGRLAGIAAARFLGRTAAVADSERLRELQRACELHARFAAAIERAYSQVPVLSAATPETTLCRCEGVTLGDLRHAGKLPVPADDLRAAKAELRCGMGACQGAVCTEAIAAVVGAGGDDPDDRRTPRARPPVMPVSVGAVAGVPTLDREVAGD